MPLLVRGGIDNGVERHLLASAGSTRSSLVSRSALAIVLADWVVNRAQTIVVGRNGERLLYTLRVKIFSHLQRLGLDFYERELTGRIMTRMTTDVDALSSFLQTGLITMVNSVLTFVGVLIALLFINLQARPDPAHDPAGAGRGHGRVPREVVAGLHRGPGAGQRGQRRPAGERGRPAGGPGLPARAGELATGSPG